ncbi:hypothetical protein DEU56DRAFT_812004 [Suillus clintonianus]|uniref:uncharacterized protein n=1 Tax=Suillus clintonianus TaxID=1904413 RepID=UPI001B85C359|nr:uncharacterized protein DEU56DRAFT_812004 [Suillus clintonianus]KAG2132780.1 hypothetical protein DEU56DRAFT_812004 [Suillus clintonianus]
MTLSCPEVTTYSPASTSKAQVEIDDEIVALEERMRALRIRRNSLSPISSLPPEILGAIFVHHVQQTQLLYQDNPEAPAILSWLNVGHVCRHWREVTLGTPELWSAPFLNSSQATEEMLVRSKMAPLKLRAGSRYRMDCVQMALMHIERLQEISLNLSPGGSTTYVTHHCITELLYKLLSCSAPKLQSLALEVGHGQTPRIAIPTSFPAPNLRNLQINHCDLSWASSFLTGLTVLDIKNLSPECLPTLDQLISALRRMPALHSLTLEDALPILPPQMVSLSPTSRAMNVRLPHLKRLCLTAKTLEVANVLACIESTASEVQLICRASSENPNREWNLSIPIISRVLERCFKGSPDKSRQIPRSMQLSSPFGIIRLHYSTIRNPPSWGLTSYLDLDLSAEWSVILDFYSPDDDVRRTILCDLQRIVPLGSIEAMYFDFFFAWDGFWTDILGRGAARNLSYMHLRGTDPVLEELLKSLRSRKHSVSRPVGWCSQQGPIFSPALSHLVLHHLEFDSSSSNLIRPSDLLDVLIDRVNGGQGLDRLEIIQTSGIFARDVQLLREVVADVSWDEYESSVETFDLDSDVYDMEEEEYYDDDDDIYSDGYSS